MRKLSLVVLLALCVCARTPTSDVTIGKSVFHVQVAATKALRERGLMGVRALATDGGMLFLWPDTSTRDFWMKDTVIPLDLISISGHRVVGVATMEPCKQVDCPITTTPPADAALELPAGTAAREAIVAGSEIQSPALKARA